ncbi:MAG TPA: orotidine-5'-phosphate decarboxylase, partial [Urbifossiella sp.]
MSFFADRLAEAVRRKGPLCVGIDPRWESLPKAIHDKLTGVPAEHRPGLGYWEFGKKVIELVRPYCGVVKPQSAFFESAGLPGFDTLRMLLEEARLCGMVTILDAKRGDIASTADAYAQAAFGPIWNADALTINPYLGRDAVEPFLSAATGMR